jgi:paraquat-inducible protein B
MSKPANKALIGVFVLGALALAVISMVVFASGKFFAERENIVMYFEGSVAGLNVGAPVVFRGVKVGMVKRIELDFDRKDLSFVIPVYAELSMDSIKTQRGMRRKTSVAERENIMAALMEKGLRAQLELQSMVTGQLMINLDFLPDKPLKLLGYDKSCTEIPTTPSGLEELLKTAQELPLKELFNKLLAAIEGIDKAVNSPNLTSSLESLSEGLKDARKILKSVDAQIDPIMTNVKESTVSIRQIFKDGEVVPEQIGEALEATRNALRQAEKTLSSVDALASGNSGLISQAESTMQEIEHTARSLRFLADYLERHPEAILTGKKPDKEMRE